MGDCCSKEEEKSGYDAFNNLNDSRHVMLLKAPQPKKDSGCQDKFPIQSGYVPRKKHMSKEKRAALKAAKDKINSTVDNSTEIV